MPAGQTENQLWIFCPFHLPERAVAIRTLPDVRLGVVSERLEHLDL
jgi:hypothetical protein